jgi:phage-related protein
MAIGLVQSTGANIAGFSGPVVPDKNYKRNRKPNVRVTKFGDGYEQRKVIGINNTSEWDISTPVSGVKSLTAKLRRVYEA